MKSGGAFPVSFGLH